MQEEKLARFKERAIFFGVNVDEEIAKKEKEEPFVFKDLSEYENMTQEEKQELTDTMMNAHKKTVKL